MRGYEQKGDIDYAETFSPVVNSSFLRILFALAVKKTIVLFTYDIKTAFLYRELDEDIYMFPPEGFSCGNKICKVKKSLYGLKQAPLKWNQRFSTFLKERNFKLLKTEQCIYVRHDRTLILGFYVDDGVLLGKDLREMNQLIEDLKREFEITVDKSPTSFLGMEIKRLPGKTKTHTRKLLFEDFEKIQDKRVEANEYTIGERQRRS